MSKKETIKLGEKTFLADSVTERGNNIIDDIQKVESLIGTQQLELSVSNLAKGKLLEELTKESSNFTEVAQEVE